MVVLVDEHVRRLDVAVDEPARVGGVERVRDLGDECQRACRRERPVVDQPAEIGAVHEAVRDVQLSFRLARRVDGQDPPMVDRRREPRLAEKALSEGRVAGQLGSYQLQGDRPVERELRRSIDDSHAASSDDLFDPVAGEL